MDNSSYFSYINNPRSLVRSFRRKFILFYTRYFNRYTRGRFDSSSNCMGSSHTESAYWVYSRNMFSRSGTLLQGVMRNPLADPGIIGVSSGAGFVAIVIMILFPQHLAFTTRGVLGAFITAMVIYALSWQKGTTFKDRLSRGVDQCINWCKERQH